MALAPEAALAERTDRLLRDPTLAEEWTYRYLAAAYAWAQDEPDMLARLEETNR